MSLSNFALIATALLVTEFMAVSKINMKVIAVTVAVCVALVYLLIPADAKKEEKKTGPLVTSQVKFSCHFTKTCFKLNHFSI